MVSARNGAIPRRSVRDFVTGGRAADVADEASVLEVPTGEQRLSLADGGPWPSRGGREDVRAHPRIPRRSAPPRHAGMAGPMTDSRRSFSALSLPGAAV